MRLCPESWFQNVNNLDPAHSVESPFDIGHGETIAERGCRNQSLQYRVATHKFLAVSSMNPLNGFRHNSKLIVCNCSAKELTYAG
jgi:hypothetical protein